ncbi:MAG TPA: hypothetical protein ENJ45_06430, partial [Phaeodactylibacter sp.]|nr:hypothetical protein [Phaeodactylibacter sp.]
DLEVEGTVFFPEIDFSQWKLVSEVPHKADEKNEMDYTFLVFERYNGGFDSVHPPLRRS